ncbi:MAG: hypothetical protein J6C95_00880 [Muribaculaceae bacterium]|nr:hypothetical protein [Muribaculaceae bacterium]
MKTEHFMRLHWRLFTPLVALLWVIIGTCILYFVNHEKDRLKESLENRLLNVNNTVIDAYEQGADLQSTVDFIKLFTDNTTLEPLRITVYDNSGNMVADNPATTISLYSSNGAIDPIMLGLWNGIDNTTVHNMSYNGGKSMICSKISRDMQIHSFAALPYEEEVTDFLSVEPTVWILVIILGIILSVTAYLGVRAICRNVYALRDLAKAISEDRLPENVSPRQFSNDELGNVSRDLVALYRDKIHAEQEKIHNEHQIAMSVSHELNTPVGIIKGYLDTILSDDNMPDDIRKRFLERARQNTDRLAELVKDMNMVMRLQENGENITCSPIDFKAMTAHIADDIKLGHIADGMTFEYNIPDDCRLLAHEPLLTNAMLNLIYNAARHSGGSKIVLSWVGRENGRHIFTFSDNGKGVKPEHLPRLFNLFYRIDQGRTRKDGGSGLGLPLVKRIINAFGGDIKVENGPDGGLSFTFSIPSA